MTTSLGTFLLGPLFPTPILLLDAIASLGLPNVLTGLFRVLVVRI